jgi:hypothetical protein
VDYWAVALVGAELLGLKRSKSERVERDGVKVIYDWFDEQNGNALVKTCQAMLKVEPEKRMTAAEALDMYLRVYCDDYKGSKRGLTTS